MTITKHFDSVRYYDVLGDSRDAKLTVMLPSEAMLTDSDYANARLKVDNAQTGFFDGREFRAMNRFSIPASSTMVYRFTANGDFILYDNSIIIDDGYIWFELVSGGTVGGVFTDIPTYRRNSMSGTPTPISAVTIATGGTYTGGTVTDTFPLRTSQSTAQLQSIGSGVSDERGLPAGVYYVRLVNSGSGAATGVIRWRWENV